MLRTLAAVLFLILLPLHSSSAASLVTDANGILTGARDILVGVNKYDVFIGDGTCAGLFSGCNEQSDFPFDTNDIVDASSALLSLLQLDGRFADAPSSINGCSALHSCNVLTPFMVSNVIITLNYMTISLNPIPDDIGSTIAGNQYTTVPDPDFTYAVWQKSPPINVPEPSTLMLLGIGWLSRRWLRTPGK